MSRGRVQNPALINPDLCRLNDKGRRGEKNTRSGMDWSQRLERQAPGHSRVQTYLGLEIGQRWEIELGLVLSLAAGCSLFLPHRWVCWVHVFTLTNCDKATGGGC